MALTFPIGGARSGKSALAVGLGHRHRGPATYVATTSALDADMANRIERHRTERRPHRTTIEEQLDLAGALDRAAGTMVILDCLTLWVSNLLAAGDDDETVSELTGSTTRMAAERDDTPVAISNEVGLGVHPTTELGRRYRDVLGRVTQCWAAQADPALFLVAGRALPPTDPHHHLPGTAR